MTALRDPGQAMAALKVANETRTRVADLKTKIASASYIEALCEVIEVIDHDHNDPRLGAARVKHLLMAVRWIGESKANRYMVAAGIHDREKRLRDLTKPQRDRLIGVLEQMAWRRVS